MRHQPYITPASAVGMARLLDDFATDGEVNPPFCPRCGAPLVDEARCGTCGRHGEATTDVAPDALWKALLENDLATIARALMPKEVQ